MTALVVLGVVWLAVVAGLVAVRPRGLELGEARRAVPDTLRLLRDLRNDRSLPRGVRRWLGALLAYLALPFDFVPDFVPVVGYADDVIVVAFVLRRVVRLAGVEAVEAHWRGTEVGLAVVKRLAGLSPPN